MAALPQHRLCHYRDSLKGDTCRDPADVTRAADSASEGTGGTEDSPSTGSGPLIGGSGENTIADCPFSIAYFPMPIADFKKRGGAGSRWARGVWWGEIGAN